jgi:hypothetical protein
VKDYVSQTGSAIETRQGRETDRVRMAGLLAFTAGLVALVLALQVALAVAMGLLSRQETRLRALAPPRFKDDAGPFPAPRLQSDAHSERERQKQADLERLNGYGWVDQKAGIAHIPIARAMEIIAHKGNSPSKVADTGRTGQTGSMPSSVPNAKASPVTKPGQKP